MPLRPQYSLTLPEIPQDNFLIERYIKEKESKHKIKPDNEARVVWADTNKQKTAFSIVYIHGFSASQEEGNPLHRRLAKELGCNLYLARLEGHGIDTITAMENFTVDKYWESAKEAYAIGKAIGGEVILMGTSTGGTLNLMLAGEFPDIIGVINMSPNIEINDPNAWILNNPWGLQIARMVTGGEDQIIKNESETFKKYWTTRYRLEAAVELEELLESKMNNKTFSKVKQPILNLYYYKNENEQDPVVRVEPIKAMHENLGTPESLKVIKAMPNVGNHVMASPIKSKDVDGVYASIKDFVISKLKLKVR